MSFSSQAYESFIFGSFIILGLALVLMQHGAKELEYNFLVPIVIVSAGKFFFSFVFFLAQDGSVSDLRVALAESKPMILSFSLSALLYCIYDVLSYVNLRSFDPGSFIVLLQLRTVTTAMVWEIAFQRTTSWEKRSALVLITLGGVMKQATNSVGGSQLHQGAVAILLLGSQILVNSCATVYNEVLIKQAGQLTLNARNMVQYGWTIGWCLLVGVMAPPGSIGFNPFDPRVWAPMSDWRMFPSILTLIFLGLVTAAFLKIWDSNWRSVACSIQVAMTGIMSAAIFGYKFTPLDALAVVVVTLGVLLYARAPADVPVGYGRVSQKECDAGERMLAVHNKV